MSKKEREEAVDQFSLWMADMDDALIRFRDTLPAPTRQKLDYSPGSLPSASSSGSRSTTPARPRACGVL